MPTQRTRRSALTSVGCLAAGSTRLVCLRGLKLADCFISAQELNLHSFYLSARRVFVTFSHFRPSLILEGKARSLPLEWRHIRDSTLLDPSLACQYFIRTEGCDTPAYCEFYGTDRITINIKSIINKMLKCRAP